MNTDPKNQISTDFQGWPEYKQTLRDILIDLGFSSQTSTFCIDDEDPILDKFVEIARDDGMGYCPYMESVVSVDKEYCRLWSELSDEDSEEIRKHIPIVYKRIDWPDIQEYMDKDWYEEESFYDPTKNAWFIPTNRY